MAELSACIVTWNGGERLARLLASLRAEGTDLEAVVVDNASRDGTPERLAREHPWARLVRNATNAGYARAANQAVAAARGRRALVLNDDVVVPPGALAPLLRALDERPDAAAAGPRLVGPDGQEQLAQGGLPTLRGLLHRVSLLRWTGAFDAAHAAWRRAPAPAGQGPRRVESGAAADVPCLSGAAFLAAREALLATPFDEGFAFGLEDADLFARLGARGPLLFVPAATLVHEGGAATRRNQAFAYRGYELGAARYLRRHDGRRAALLLYKLLVTLDQPARAAGAGLEALGRALGGRGARARESARRLGAVLRFLATGLPALWRE